jgi:hypothetical protein
MIKTRSDAGMSLKFAILDASGDLASLISVISQPYLEVLGLVVYGYKLAIWFRYFRVLNRKVLRSTGSMAEIQDYRSDDKLK